jgi:hypothetical protein
MEAPRIAKPFLKGLADLLPDAFPRRWGDCEPLSTKASAADYSQVVPLWVKVGRERGNLFGMSPRGGLLISFMLGPTLSPHDIGFDFPLKLVASSNKLQRSLELFSTWVETLCADFALFATQAEWQAKNVREQYMEKDGSIDPWKVFARNITEGLPGVYWCTYFGPPFVEWIGAEKLAHTPWLHASHVGQGYLLRRSDRPDSWEGEAEQDRGLISHLGRARFFDIRDPDRKMSVLDLPMPK